MNGTNRPITRGSEIQSAAAKLVSQVRALHPEVQSFTLDEHFEDEDAVVMFYAAPANIEAVRSAAARISTELLLESDIDIAVLIRASGCQAEYDLMNPDWRIFGV